MRQSRSQSLHRGRIEKAVVIMILLAGLAVASLGVAGAWFIPEPVQIEELAS